MLRKYAWQFYLLHGFLLQLHKELGITTPDPFAEVGLQPIGGVPRIGGLASAYLGSSGAILEERQSTNVVATLRLVSNLCSQIGVGIEKDIERAIAAAAPFSAIDRVRFHVETINERIKDELSDEWFLHVPSGKADHYSNTEPFGAEVGRKMPRVSEDISNASACYALGQNTACVFHLMRTMEHCVQRFGRKLRVSLDPARSSWSEIMDHVNGRVKALPGGKNHTRAQNIRKQKFSMAAGRLDHVRIVWRNEVMHPKETYDGTQALEVLTAVGAFLQSVAPLL